MTGDGLRERKKQDTRIALSWATIRLAVERGLDNVRVEDIAAAAGVSPRTFNNYFASKAEAIAARHFDRARLIADELRARPLTEPLWAALRTAMLARYALGQEGDPAGVPTEQWSAGVGLMLAEPALQGEFLRAGAAAEAELADAIAERTGAAEPYPKLLAGAVMGVLNAVTQHWLRADPPVAMAELLEDAIDQLSSGFPTE